MRALQAANKVSMNAAGVEVVIKSGSQATRTAAITSGAINDGPNNRHWSITKAATFSGTSPQHACFAACMMNCSLSVAYNRAGRAVSAPSPVILHTSKCCVSN